LLSPDFITMQPVIAFLLQYGALTGQQIDLISAKTQIRTLKANEYFSEAGKIAREVGFITSASSGYVTTTGKAARLPGISLKKTTSWQTSTATPTKSLQ
jgi:hypothetical protein